MNDREIMDITVKYHVKGSEMVTWQNVTRAELLAILEHVESAIKNGTKVESFSFSGNLYI